MKVVGCSTAFFVKSKFVFEIPLKCLSIKLLASFIIIIIIVNVHLFTAGKQVSHKLKKGVNLSQLKDFINDRYQLFY